MRAVIFTEGSAQWGMGHLYRCSAYADELAAAEWTVSWRVCGDGFAERFLNENSRRNGHVDRWYDRPDPIAETGGADLALIDSYYAPVQTYAVIANRVPACVYLDDEARLAFPQGVVANSSPGADKLPYMLGPSTHLLAGPVYHPLRAEFRTAFNRSISDEIKEVLVLMGGTDLRKLTPLAAARARNSFPHARIRAVVPDATQRAQWTGTSGALLLPSQSATELRRLMEEADLCISATGQTLFEICRMGLPAVGIMVAENQRYLSAGMSDAKAVLSAGSWDDVDLPSSLEACLASLRSHESRAALARSGPILVDGKGCGRVLQSVLKTFTPPDMP